jgi:hypothetical protein
MNDTRDMQAGIHFLYEICVEEVFCFTFALVLFHLKFSLGIGCRKQVEALTHFSSYPLVPHRFLYTIAFI